MGMLFRKRATLGTAESEIGGVVGITDDTNGPAVLDGDEDSAIRVAETADRGMDPRRSGIDRQSHASTHASKWQSRSANSSGEIMPRR